jgi:hypothetical protein
MAPEICSDNGAVIGTIRNEMGVDFATNKYLKIMYYALSCMGIQHGCGGC